MVGLLLGAAIGIQKNTAQLYISMIMHIFICYETSEYIAFSMIMPIFVIMLFLLFKNSKNKSKNFFKKRKNSQKYQMSPKHVETTLLFSCRSRHKSCL